MAINLMPAQTRLASLGLYTGAIDNIMGPATMAGLMMRGAGARTPTPVMTAIAPALVAILDEAQLNTQLRLCHFLAQATEESWNWRTLVELGTASYFATNYDPGTAAGDDVGNTLAGDGFKFRGRGPLQLTGRPNYMKYGPLIGADIVDNPDLLVTNMTLSAKSAAQYWLAKGVNQWADADNVQRVTLLINGGLNGLPARQVTLQLLKGLWGNL